MQVIQDCKGIMSQIQASLELSKSRTGEHYFESAYKSDQAGNEKFIYCDRSGLAADNQL